MTRYRTCGGCGQLVAGTCPTCGPPRGRAGRSPSTRAQRGDGGLYVRNRALVLARDRICQLCHANPATTVDHIVPVSRGGSNRLENLRGSCEHCNLSRQANPDWRPR